MNSMLIAASYFAHIAILFVLSAVVFWFVPIPKEEMRSLMWITCGLFIGWVYGKMR